MMPQIRNILFNIVLPDFELMDKNLQVKYEILKCCSFQKMQRQKKGKALPVSKQM